MVMVSVETVDSLGQIGTRSSALAITWLSNAMNEAKILNVTEISMIFVPDGLINIESALVQVIVLSNPWPGWTEFSIKVA